MIAFGSLDNIQNRERELKRCIIDTFHSVDKRVCDPLSNSLIFFHVIDFSFSKNVQKQCLSGKMAVRLVCVSTGCRLIELIVIRTSLFLVSVFIIDDILYVANLGDSKAVLCRPSTADELSAGKPNITALRLTKVCICALQELKDT